MPWIESHDDIADHKKTQNLCAILNISVPLAVGTVHLLWHYTVRTAWDNGDLEGHSPQHIARACWWDGDAKILLAALQKSGFMDGMKVHDWNVYARELIYQRRYSKSKRSNSCKTGEKQVDDSCFSASTKPYPTLPNLTNKNTCRFSFEEIWSKYPNKDGRKLAERSFKASVTTDQDWSDINKALENYLRSEKVLKGYIKNGSTWFNNWRDWVNYEGVPAQDGMTPRVRELLEKTKGGAHVAS